MMKLSSRPFRILPVAAAICTATLALAQTPPPKPAQPRPAAKPAAAPASAPESRTLSGKDASGSKLLTRDELRACLKQRDALSTRLADLDTTRQKLDAERVGLGQEQAALKTERETMAGMRAEIDALNAKTKAFQEEVDGWQKRVAAFNESPPSGSAAERTRNELNEQAEALKKRQAALQTERDSVLGRGDQAIKAFNAKAQALEQKVGDWNDRNAKLNADVEKTKTERETWSTECGDRRYREEDEKAILSGR